MELLLEGLEVDVGGARLDGLQEDELDEADDGGGGGGLGERLLVHLRFVSDADAGRLEVGERKVVVDRGLGAAVVAGDAVKDLLLAREGEADLLAEDEAELVGDEGARDRVGGEGDGRVVGLDRHDVVHARHGALDGGEVVGVDVDAGEGDDLAAGVGGDGAEQVVLGEVVAVDDDVARLLAGALLLFEDFVARGVVEHPGRVERLEDGVGGVVLFSHGRSFGLTVTRSHGHSALCIVHCAFSINLVR